MPGTPIECLIGSNLQILRTLAQITEAEFAAALGISEQLIRDYESGAKRMPVGLAVKAAQKLGQPVSVLFEGVDDPPSDQGES